MNDRPLRSNLPVGSSRWAVRRAEWRALGITDEDMTKPKIAIVNSSSDLAACYAHLDGIVGPLKEAIRQAGGLPFEVRTTAPSDFITSVGKDGRYILPTRDLITSDIEVAVEGAQLDAMICLASCDKTVPGQLMAAARLDIPTIMVPCGYQPSGCFRGERIDIEEVFLQAGHHAAGRITLDELTGMTDEAILGPGVCTGMGTANSMAISCEALGMALPGTTPVLANSPAMWDAVAQAGARIVELVGEGITPRRILTERAFRNAATVMLSLAGSINTIKHLQAIAVEAGVGVDVWGLFETLADEVPLVAAIRPNGPRRIEELTAAGGARGVMKQLEPLLDTAARSVSGQSLAEILAAAPPADAEVIRPAHDPFGTRPAIVIMRGSLAPDGAVVKLPVTGERPQRFSGPARVYHTREEGIAGLAAGEVRPGDVVVLSGIGLRGGPGMGLTSALIFAIDGAGLGKDVAFVTDGQFSGLVNTGITVGEVSPEAAAGGPLSLVRNGDTITIDLDTRTVDLNVPPGELAGRAAQPAESAAATTGETGWLGVYERAVRPLAAGATLSGTTSEPEERPG